MFGFGKKRAIMLTMLTVIALQADTTKIWDFEKMKPGAVPAGWRVSATHPKEPMAVWKVVEVADAPSGKKVLALTRPNDTWFNGGIFNLCYTREIGFKDGEISVKFKANSGRTDQGGGIMWRVQDDDNYYVARFNPLEDNFRFYIVKNGHRHELASADVRLSKGWHTMRIVQHGDRFEGYLDGKKLLSHTDSQLPKRGGAGLWTKADAATSFDDFRVVTDDGKTQK